MKTIPLKTIALSEDGEKKIDYKELIAYALNFDGTGHGFTLEDIEKRLNVLRKVRECTESSLILEDAEHQFLVACVGVTRWKTVQKAVLEFFNDIKS